MFQKNTRFHHSGYEEIKYMKVDFVSFGHAFHHFINKHYLNKQKKKVDT